MTVNYSTASMIPILLVTFPIFLFFAAIVLFVFRKFKESVANTQLVLLSTGLVIFTSFLVYSGIKYQPLYSFKWFDFRKPLAITYGLDYQGSLMLALVVFITLLVIFYSTSYMKGEQGYSRYFASLFVFAASMVGIVLSFNLLLTFVFWELVGFCSYLLINFWYKKPSANQAARKAFIANRIGDLGFMMGLGLLYAEYGTFEINEIANAIKGGQLNETRMFWAGLGIFMGCIGKSAQFPLLVWLPDAMQAPTPVSALLHAATMVAAGVFLLARIFPILSPEVLTIMAYVGAITSLVGAFSAASQTDIKKILAYSTVSQLGYMVAALGAHSYFAPLFHLFTHAMFKACLFLCAGSIIHAMAHLKHYTKHDFDPQDIRLMGGLRKRMPLTFLAFMLAAFASAGIPMSAGFLSKDEILAAVCSWAAIQENPIHFVLPILIFSTSLMTAFYTGRMFFLVFFGSFRLGKFYNELKGFSTYVHEAPKPMLIACLILAPFCLFILFSVNPIDPDMSWLTHYLKQPPSVFASESIFQSRLIHKQEELHYWVISFSVVILSIGFGMAYVLYGVKTRFKKEFVSHPSNTEMGVLTNLSYNGLYLNQFYELIFIKPFTQFAFVIAKFDRKAIDASIDKSVMLFVTFSHFAAWFDKFVVDGFVSLLIWAIEFLGKQLKVIQNGKVQSYLLLAFCSLVALVIWALV